MKRAIISSSAMVICICTIVAFFGFTPEIKTHSIMIPAGTAGESKPVPVTFHTVATGSQGSVYTGTVEVSGGITASGTYVMPTEVMGMALHCILTLNLPGGTITIRMNCNMVTFYGTWQITEGTGSYKTLKGNGSLVMPDDIQEILTGNIRW
jgi:hypothetical protein